MPRKSAPIKVIGFRPRKDIPKETHGKLTDDMYDRIPDEFYKTEDWRVFWFNENVKAAKAVGGRPKQIAQEPQAVH